MFCHSQHVFVCQLNVNQNHAQCCNIYILLTSQRHGMRLWLLRKLQENDWHCLTLAVISLSVHLLQFLSVMAIDDFRILPSDPSFIHHNITVNVHSQQNLGIHIASWQACFWPNGVLTKYVWSRWSGYGLQAKGLGAVTMSSTWPAYFSWPELSFLWSYQLDFSIKLNCMIHDAHFVTVLIPQRGLLLLHQVSQRWWNRRKTCFVVVVVVTLLAVCEYAHVTFLFFSFLFSFSVGLYCILAFLVMGCTVRSEWEKQRIKEHIIILLIIIIVALN